MESKTQEGAPVNIILDGGNNYASFAAGKVVFDNDSAKVGWVNIEGNDLVGFDDKGNKKLIITKGTVPRSGDVTDGEAEFLKKDAFEGVTITEESSGNTDNGGGFYHSNYSGSGENYSHHFRMFDTYHRRIHDLVGYVRFKVPFTLKNSSYVTFNISLDISSDEVSNNSTVSLYKDNGAYVMGNLDNSRNLLDAGKYYLDVYMSYSTPTLEDNDSVLTVQLGLHINSIKIERLLNCNILGSNGLVSRYGSNKYLYFSDREGFEVRFGNYGIKVSEDGLRRYSNGAWVTL